MIQSGISAIDEVVPHILAASKSWGVGGDHLILVHGSRVEGFANTTSDADCWIISAKGHPPPFVPVFEWVESYRVQPESISWETLELLATTVNQTDEQDISRILGLKAPDLCRYYRFATSIAIVDTTWATSLREQFSTNHIARLLTVRYGVAAYTELRKAEIFGRLGNQMDEGFCLQRAVEFAIDSYLAKAGEAYPNRKWRFEKLRRRFGSDSGLYQRSLELKRQGLRPVDSYRQDCLAFINNLLTDRLPQPVVFQPLQDVSVFTLGSQDYLMAGSTAVYEVSPHGRLLWQMMGAGASFDDLIERFHNHTGINAVNIVCTFVNEFRAYGLLDLMPLFD